MEEAVAQEQIQNDQSVLIDNYDDRVALSNEIQTPQHELTAEERLLIEQRQLSSIASFGQIHHNSIIQHANNLSNFQMSEKDATLTSFQQNGTYQSRPDHKTLEDSEVPSAKVNAQDMGLSGTKRNVRVNSLGFGDMAAIAVANGLLPAQNSISFEDADKVGTQIFQGNHAYATTQSPSKLRATFLGEKIVQSHIQQQHQSQLVQDTQEKLGQERSINLQLNIEKKNRSKSSTRKNDCNFSQDSQKEEHVQYEFADVLKQNSIQIGQQQQNFFGPVISKQQIKYHKNAFTNRGGEGTKFQALLKMQQTNMSKNNSYQAENAQPKSPHTINTVTHAQNSLGLMFSAHSKNSVANNVTMRSQISQNSMGTQGGFCTNRGEVLSLQHKSPNMSDIQDPYVYFNMHQQQQSVNTPSGPIHNSGNQNMKKLETQLISEKSQNNKLTQEESRVIVKSCRPNLYNKQIITNRQGQKVEEVQEQSPGVPQTPYVIQSKNDQQQRTSIGQKVHSGTTDSAQYYLNQKTDNKNMLGVLGSAFGSAGSVSHGSNFNSSTSTFPAAPIQKLSDVKTPQKLTSFRFVNRKATKLQEIGLFKNLLELDLSGNLLQEQVKELQSLSFLKKLSLCNNKIQTVWLLPQSLEILNISYNLIKLMPEDVCKNLKNITTLEISNNKLESLENIQYMQRIKRLLSKNNFVSKLAPIAGLKTIFEIDLEGNAIDSHKDFLSFIKEKNDLLVCNLVQNPLMVEVTTIEKFNEELIQRAPELITRKTPEEIAELKQILCTSLNNQSSIDNSQEQDTNRFNFNLIEELARCLNFLKNGILYRNKRVFMKLKQLQLKSKRSASNYSNSSYHLAKQNKGGSSNQDRNSTKLTPPSGASFENKHVNRYSNVQPSTNYGARVISNSVGFSPIPSIKSQEYEYVEQAYDNIVEQEELKRLKLEKILTKKKKLMKQQMVSELDGTSKSSSDDFSDEELLDDDDELDDELEDLGDLGLIDIDDLDEENGSLIEYNQHLHDEEVMSQTITSDLEADMHSYKRLGENNSHLDLPDAYYNNKTDDEYLNGSTAGFGKKLREINREINQEQLADQTNDSMSMGSQQLQIVNKKQLQLYSDQKGKIMGPTIKNKQKFDLKLGKLQQETTQQNNHVKTTQNSNENSQESQTNLLVKMHQTAGIVTTTNSNEDRNYANDNQQQLNQSFSLKNLQTDHEVESLMMNKHMGQVDNAFAIQKIRKPTLKESQSQNIKAPNFLNLPLQSANQSVNQSLCESLVQSVTSVTQNSKKNLPSFKLDLSKCKQDDELVYNEEEIVKLEDIDISTCSQCKNLQKIIFDIKEEHKNEMEVAEQKILELKQVLNELKKNLVLGSEDIDFQVNSKASLNLGNFAYKVQLLYRKLYAELVKSRNLNSKLIKSQKAQQQKFIQMANRAKNKVPLIENLADLNSEELGKVIKPLNTTTSRINKNQKRYGSGTYQVADTPEVFKKVQSSAKNTGAGSGTGQIVIKQQPRVYGKETAILQIKKNDIQMPKIPSLSSSEMNSVMANAQQSMDEGDATIKYLKNQSASNSKKMDSIVQAKTKNHAAKTMRNLPSQEIEDSARDQSAQQQEAQKIQKFMINQSGPKTTTQYEANTFSSQYSQNHSMQQNSYVFHSISQQENDPILLQDSRDEPSYLGSKKTSQLQLMTNNGIKVLKPQAISASKKSQRTKTENQTEVHFEVRKESNTSRAWNPNIISQSPQEANLKKVKIKKMQQLQQQTINFTPPENGGQDDCAESRGDGRKLSNSMKSTSKNLPTQGPQQNVSKLNHLQKSLEQIARESSQQNNYKTSRIPVTNSKSFIEAAANQHKAMVAEDSKKDFYSLLDHQYNFNSKKQMLLQIPKINQIPMIHQSNYQTQRKSSKSGVSGISTIRPVSRENKTQRLQRQQLLNKSGGGTQEMLVSVQPQSVYPQEFRGQSVAVNMQQIAEGFIQTPQNHDQIEINKNFQSQNTGKRPQSVAESGGRKFQKINTRSNRQEKHSKKLKSKNKSTERRSSKQRQSSQNKVNISKNIINIQNIQNMKQLQQQRPISIGNTQVLFNPHINFSANQEDLQRKNSFNSGLNISKQSKSINLTQQNVDDCCEEAILPEGIKQSEQQLLKSNQSQKSQNQSGRRSSHHVKGTKGCMNSTIGDHIVSNDLFQKILQRNSSQEQKFNELRRNVQVVNNVGFSSEDTSHRP